MLPKKLTVHETNMDTQLVLYDVDTSGRYISIQVPREFALKILELWNKEEQ